MTPTELRALAETLEHECALRLIAGGKNHEEAQACEQAADYLRQCAEQQPVAWWYRGFNPLSGERDEQYTFTRWPKGIDSFSERKGAVTEPLYAAPVAPQAEKHPDEAAVDRFAAAMKLKLAEKRRQGKSGWDDPRCPTEHLAALLREHVTKGDPLDVGNFAMMLWCRGGSTNATQAEPCIGSDPACPCQDGDACHYKDTPTTKAWPIPQSEPKRPVIEVITEFDAIGNWCRVALTVDGHRFFMEHCSEHPDDAEDFAERLRKALGITVGSDAE